MIVPVMGALLAGMSVIFFKVPVFMYVSLTNIRYQERLMDKPANLHANQSSWAVSLPSFTGE